RSLLFSGSIHHGSVFIFVNYALSFSVLMPLFSIWFCFLFFLILPFTVSVIEIPWLGLFYTTLFFLMFLFFTTRIPVYYLRPRAPGLTRCNSFFLYFFYLKRQKRKKKRITYR